MSKNSTNGKPLRFAALIRVSTEKQERQGESLRTQASQIEQAVESMGGKIVQRYAGQEHATAGWERQQLDKLLADAASRQRAFDAVIMADATRWSRDNVASDTGLEALRDAGVRFFVLGTEHDLFNPEARLFLRMTATIGAYHAHNQNKKSIENRIKRAERGIPTCGKQPFGRVWDTDKQSWTLDPVKQSLITDVAGRYLAGESLPKLAKEHGMNHSNLCKLLRERCGDQWKVEFRADDLGIHKLVTITVPRLLPEKTIKAIHERLKANRTYLHKPPISKNEYLLSGRVFCAACGYCMFGQLNHNGHRYYRHCHTDRVRQCPLNNPRPWVRADVIEAAVVGDLFNMHGNVAAIERAVKAAAPDCEKLLGQRQQVDEELSKIDRARNRVLGLIDKDAITDSQAEAKLRELKEREAGLRATLDKLNAALECVPDAETVRLYVERFGTNSIALVDEDGNEYAGGNSVSSFLLMTKRDRRDLVSSVFSSPMPDGTPAGVYVTPAGGDLHGPKRFRYHLQGRLIGSVMPRSLP